MAYKDIKLTTLDGDLEFKNGDFVIWESDNQHIFDIISDNPGDWKQFPLVGVSAELYVNGSNMYTLAQKVKQQLQSDGYDVGRVDIKVDNATSKITINPNAKR